MKRKLVFLILVQFMVLTVNYSSASAAVAHENESIYACPLNDGQVVNIDGYLEPSIWNFTYEVTITMIRIGFYDQYDEIQFVAMYNSTMLFIGAIVPDIEIHGDDRFTMTLKTNPDEDLIAQMSPSVHHGGDHDFKGVYSAFNTSFDGFTLAGSLATSQDLTYGGTSDIWGKCVHNGTHYSYEMVISLDSGDTSGHDISLQDGSSIDFMIHYFDNGVSYPTFISWGQFRNGFKDYEYQALVLGSQQSSTITLTIFTIGFGVILVISLSKKRNRSY